MTPLLGTKTPSAPVGDSLAGDDKAAQATSFQVFTRPETRDTASAWREAQAGANSEVFTKHGLFQARNTAFPWLLWCSLVLKPFSLFFGRGTVYLESDDAVVGNKTLIRARRGQVGWGRKSHPIAAFLRIVARQGAAMARHGRHGAPRAAIRTPSAPATAPFGFSRNTKHETRNTAITVVRFSVGARGVASPETAVRTTAPAGKSMFSSSPLFTIVHYCSPLFSKKILSCASALVPPGRCFPARCGAAWAAWAAWGAPSHCSRTVLTSNRTIRVFTKHETRDTNHGFFAHAAAVGW